ncbi:hypothetical protein KUM42_12130 [Modestobacter sp. L9-4]|uniref:hypothetical protein n=1 Tax=Modestobacter sp. L9-4 TaxID=2851567 RepID=UPI001C7578A5|nr:hypothetical protein [Modestobacter sp. L9-4]QXG74635.1 hypothetical protein KUM42_12130 [Modestobacter sp. L9-4]
MFLLLMLAWFVLGAATMVVVAALGRAGRLQDERRAAATGLTTQTTDRRPVVARAA